MCPSRRRASRARPRQQPLDRDADTGQVEELVAELVDQPGRGPRARGAESVHPALGAKTEQPLEELLCSQRRAERRTQVHF